MRLIWSIGALVCLAISGILISSVIVLSLIPLYTPFKSTIVSREDNLTRDFAFSGAFTKISKRDLSSVSIDYADSDSFPFAQRFLRDLLITRAGLSRSISVEIKEIDIVYSVNSVPNNTLYFVGQYVFDPFCKLNCQNRLLDSSVNNLTLSNLNLTLPVLIHQAGHEFMLLNLKAVDLTNTNGTLTLDYELTSDSNSSGNTSDLNGDKSKRALVAKTFGLTDGYRNIPFTILPERNRVSNDNQLLNITLQVKYPVFYIGDILYNINKDFISLLLGIGSERNFTHEFAGITYRVVKIDATLPDALAPVPIYKLEYDLGNQTANISQGVITDENTFENISTAIKQDLFNNSEVVKVRRISIEEVGNTKGYEIASERSSSKNSGRFVLVIIIEFVFNSPGCDRFCQATHVQPQLKNLNNTLTVFIFMTSIILPPPTIHQYGQSISIPTTTATTTENPSTTNILG